MTRSRKRLPSLRKLLGLLALALLLAAPLTVAARPGGGQSYHAAPSHSSSSSSSSHSYSAPSHSYSSSPSSHSYSPSSSSSSSSSSGGGGGGGGLVVLIFLVIVIFILYTLFKKRMSGGGERARVGVDSGTQAGALAALKSHDPAFDAAKFAERARTVMAKVNEAWCNGAMGPARRLISDGVYVRFQTQLQILKQQGLRNAMADWQAVSCDILAAESDARWDTVHVQLTATARDMDVPATLSTKDALAKAKSAPAVQYQEVWSFLRRRGGKSKDGVPALEGSCPNCGAEMPMSEVVRCEYCKAVVNSGEHDWVLAEITQPEEWRPSNVTGEIPGLAELDAKDPTVSRQELEDRGSVVFWKWIDAVVTGQRTRLERFCRQPGEPPVARAPLTQVVVGSSELAHVFVDEGGFDRVVVDIVWSAGEGGGEPVNRTSRLFLTRASDAKSKRGLSSLDCPNCGGQLADSDSAKCSYCGEPVAGNKSEWCLQDISHG